MSELLQIQQQIEAETNACAAHRKTQGLSGFFTRYQRFYDDCKVNVTRAHQAELNAAQAKENSITDTINKEFSSEINGGLSNGTKMILLAAFLLIVLTLTIIIILK